MEGNTKQKKIINLQSEQDKRFTKTANSMIIMIITIRPIMTTTMIISINDLSLLASAGEATVVASGEQKLVVIYS